MIDVVTLIILVCVSGVGCVGIMENIISIPTAIRIAMFLFPALVYKRKRVASLCALGCFFSILMSRSMLALYLTNNNLVEGVTYNITNTLFKTSSGLADIAIVSIYFFLITALVYYEIEGSIFNVTSSKSISIKNKTVIDDYLFVNAFTTIVFIVTGLWDYSIQTYMIPIFIYMTAFIIIYYYSRKHVDNLYREAAHNLFNTESFKEAEKECYDLTSSLKVDEMECVDIGEWE